MPDFPSLRVKHQSGSGDGVGVIDADIDSNGITVYAPDHFKRDTYVIHPREAFSIPLIATTPVDTCIWSPPEGVWVVDKVMSHRRVVCASGTADIMVCASGVAPASGVTQLSAANALLLSTPAADVLANHALATILTECGPGSYFALHLAGTLTNLVGTLTVEFKRLR